MRILHFLIAFWLLAALGIAVMLALGSGSDEPGQPKTPPPLSCASLGERAKRCQKELLEAAGEFVETASLRAGRSPLSAGGRRLALTTFLDGFLGRGELPKECEKHRAMRAPMIQRLWRELERCWSKPGCRAFVACLRQVAEAEEKAGRLPL